MIYLLLAAFASLLVVIIFKLFGTYKVESFQAIVANYFTCTTIAYAITTKIPDTTFSAGMPWLPYLLILGGFFVGGFYIASMTVQHFGLAVASVAQRMSLVISVSFAILFFGEASSVLKLGGIITALLAVVFINIPQKKEITNLPISKLLYLYPISIFLISGIIEIILQYVQKAFAMPSDIQSFLLFGIATIIGIICITIALLSGQLHLDKKSLLGGVVLGIPNYFSIYFLLMALEQIDGSIVYPVNNILIVGAAALVGYTIFKEQLSRINLLGVVLAMLAILMITIS